MCSGDFVTIAPGLTVRRELHDAILGLEIRGAVLTLDGDDVLVRPSGLLTADERRILATYKRHVRCWLAMASEGKVQ